MRLFLLTLMAALPCAAQFLSIEIGFQGIGCASCIESLPERMKRLRGVESVTVDAASATLKLQLAEQNRVRLEQVRDMIEQDGTKVKRATVRVKGDLTHRDGKWMLQPSGLPVSYEVAGKDSDLEPGTKVIAGEVADLHPPSGNLVIRIAK